MLLKNMQECRLYIWENRPHVSELSGDGLLYPGHPQWHWQFMHLLSRQTYTYWKYETDNIILGTVWEHENQEDIKLFKELQDEARRKYLTLYEGKQF